MDKLILLSILVAAIAIPLACSRDRVALRGLKRSMALLLIFEVVYVALVCVAYPDLARSGVASFRLFP